MSESKHTPGPWIVYAGQVRTMDGRYILADLHPWDSDPAEKAEAEANARLIARAPTLAAEVEELRAENDKLRAKLGNSPEPCAYCGIPADKLLDCQHGFPGCPRADDMVLCGHFGAAMETAKLREALAAERHKVKEQAAEVERLRAEAASFHMDYRMKCDEETKRLAVEVERLRAERDDDEATRAMMSDILSRTAVALRGQEPDGTRYGWSDLPERVAAAIAAIDVMQKAAALNGAEVERLREENAALRDASLARSLNAALSANDAQRREVEALRQMVQESAALFRRYEKLHRDKGTDDGLRKAEANAEIAARCDAALAAADPQRGSEAQG